MLTFIKLVCYKWLNVQNITCCKCAIIEAYSTVSRDQCRYPCFSFQKVSMDQSFLQRLNKCREYDLLHLCDNVRSKPTLLCQVGVDCCVMCWQYYLPLFGQGGVGSHLIARVASSIYMYKSQSQHLPYASFSENVKSIRHLLVCFTIC